MDEIFNERVKSTSAWLNQLATAVIAVGVLTPTVSLYFGLHNLRPINGSIFAITYAFLVGVTLHLFSRDMLGRLKT